jgi:hypothetical protein
MAINRTGFQQTSTGLEITKDTEAQIIYTFDWSDYLATGDSLSTSTYTVAARRNDPSPVSIVSQGIASANTKTYVELSGGQENKVYIVTCKITTADGVVDRRNFRLKVLTRSA